MGWPQTQTVFDLGIESMVHINIHVWMRCVYVFPMQLEPNEKQNKQRTEKKVVFEHEKPKQKTATRKWLNKNFKTFCI